MADLFLTFDQVDVLVQDLAAVGVQASTNPEDLNLPAVWVNVEGVTQANVAADLRIGVALYLIVPETDHRRAMDQLATLWNVVRTVVRPHGATTVTGVVLPDNPTPMPALRVPVRLHSIPTPPD